MEFSLNASSKDDGIDLHDRRIRDHEDKSQIDQVESVRHTSGYFCKIFATKFFVVALSALTSNSSASKPASLSPSKRSLRLPRPITLGLEGREARARANALPIPEVAPVTRIHLELLIEGDIVDGFERKRKLCK